MSGHRSGFEVQFWICNDLNLPKSNGCELQTPVSATGSMAQMKAKAASLSKITTVYPGTLLIVLSRSETQRLGVWTLSAMRDPECSDSNPPTPTMLRSHLTLDEALERHTKMQCALRTSFHLGPRPFPRFAPRPASAYC